MLKCSFLQWLWLVDIFPTAMDIAFMSSQRITPTIGLVAAQTPDHFVSTNNVSIPSYAFQPSYNHWIIITTTTTTTHNQYHCSPAVSWLNPHCTLSVPPLYPDCTPTVPWVYPRCTPTGTHYTPAVPWLYPECTPAVPWLYLLTLLHMDHMAHHCSKLPNHNRKYVRTVFVTK